MLEVIFLFALALVWIIFASVQDLRSREVANWLVFSLGIFGLSYRLMVSLFSSDIMFFVQGLVGAGVFIGIGFLFYYSRLFAGGDAKLMMALGPLLGFSSSFITNFKLYLLFLVFFLAAGALYGIVAMIGISIRQFSVFKKAFLREIKKRMVPLLSFMILGLFFMGLGFVYPAVFGLGVLVFIFPYLIFYARIVDSVCMKRKIATKDLTEGEWLYRSVLVGKKTIAPRWEGVSSKEISLLRKKHKYVWIKQGVPFVPVFLIAFLMYLYIWKTGFWNMFF